MTDYLKGAVIGLIFCICFAFGVWFWKSVMNEDLPRTLVVKQKRIILYNCDGTPLKVWQGDLKVKLRSANNISFIDTTGLEVITNGFYIIEEIR